MKKPLLLALLVSLQVPGLLAQQPGSTPSNRRAFFERIFGTGGNPQSGSKTESPKSPRLRGETGTWQLFPAGKLPAGKAVNEADAAKLSVGNYQEQNIYLIGNFIVTAETEHQAILRFVDAKTRIRIIAEYSSEVPAPSMGTKLILDESRGLLVKSATRAPDDTLNLVVRDITVPQPPRR